MFAVVVVLNLAGNFLHLRGLARVNTSVLYKLRTEMHDHLQKTVHALLRPQRGGATDEPRPERHHGPSGVHDHLRRGLRRDPEPCGNRRHNAGLERRAGRHLLHRHPGIRGNHGLLAEARPAGLHAHPLRHCRRERQPAGEHNRRARHTEHEQGGHQPDALRRGQRHSPGRQPQGHTPHGRPDALRRGAHGVGLRTADRE